MRTFIDNQDGNTMGKAVSAQLASYREYARAVPEVCIATAYFNPGGFLLLADELAYVPTVRLLLGAEPKPEAMRLHRVPGDPYEPEFSQRQVKGALATLEHGLARDRDLLAFSGEASQSIKKTIAMLRAPNIEVRRFEKNFLHAKAYLFRQVPTRGLIAGSSNLTLAGLTWNKELNLGVYGNDTVEKGGAWFDALWEAAVPYDLASIYEAITSLCSPKLVYLKVLDLIYGQELADEVMDNGKIPLTQFQSHGVWRALKIIDTYHGVIVADEVGLGKSFIAGEIMGRYSARHQRALLVCPASLRDTTWTEFLNRYQMFAECVGYEELANDSQLAGKQTNLKMKLDEYALIVVDEAHNYRNPSTRTRARVLQKLLQGSRKDLLLLTATPVNNSLWDLYHLVRFFIKQDAQLAHRGIISIRETFAKAMSEDAFSLSPDVLFPIVDATTVKRTRSFVRKYYSGDMIKGENGVPVKIKFPKPKALTISYSLEKALPGIFDKIEVALAPKADEESPRLKLARYNQGAYKRNKTDEEWRANESFLGLLRTGLLKRFESSAAAFVGTCCRMLNEHNDFLSVIDKGKVPTTKFLREIAGAEDESEFDSFFCDSDIDLGLDDASDYDIISLRHDLESDLAILKELHDEVALVAGRVDPKFDALCDALAGISEEARSEGFDDEDARQNRKVIIFSYFEDTVDDIEAKLLKLVETDVRLAAYKGRIASASGSSESRSGISRTQAVEGFVPKSTRSSSADLYDLLIATDVLAEGQNLQQARHVINYDLPWNPMRLVQRHGRIDRIGSPHEKVFMRTIFPDDRLNDLLNLEERVRRKLAHAAASVGVGHSPIESGSTCDMVFSETREEIEKLFQQNPEIYEGEGYASAAQTGEEYRQVLRNAQEAWAEKIASLPWKSGSKLVRDSDPGWFFCAKVGDRNYLRFVRPDSNGCPSEKIEAEMGFCLRQIKNDKTEVPAAEGINMDAVYAAWRIARRSILEAWDYETDPANLQPKVRPLNKSVAERLRTIKGHCIDAGKLAKSLDILESPWPLREENKLREWIANKVDSPILVENILSIGIEPFVAPAPLPQAIEEDVHLVVWLVVECVPKSSAEL